MFGRSPRLPVDVFLGVPAADNINATARSVRENLEAAYKAASDASKQARARQAQGYNKRVRDSSLEIGEFVLVKNTGLKASIN